MIQLAFAIDSSMQKSCVFLWPLLACSGCVQTAVHAAMSLRGYELTCATQENKQLKQSRQQITHNMQSRI